MNLWIRSQDKKKLVNINAVNILEFEALIAIHGYINSETHFWLGNYKTKERALEILDEIQHYILLPNTDNSAYVYQMPKD